jgi:uncharacterized protein (DUF885 family)
MNKQFEGILDRYFETVLEDHPVYATVAGLTDGEGKLDHATRDFENRQHKRRLNTLSALENVSPRDLSNEQQLDRLALRSELLRECEEFARGRSGLEPDAPERVLNILLHELIRGDDEPKRAARNVRSLLDQTPRFLGEALTLIERPEQVWLKIMRQTTDGADALFSAIDTFLKRNASESKDAGRISAAKKSLTQYRNKVESKRLAPKGSFAIGAEEMQRRVRDGLGLDYTLREIETLALRETERIGGLLRKATGGRDPVKVIEKARGNWRPEKPLLELYRETTSRVADRFRKARAVTFPEGDELDVRPVPDFMRPLFPTAAYSSPGAFEKRQRGIFWVNDLSVTKTSADEKLKEQQQHFGLSLTCAHEAYPGHHLQFVTANRHPRKWRRLFAHAVFYEGWTLWCEQMMADLKIDKSPWLRIQQLHDALWRAHRILVDIRLQTRRYTYEQAVKHMQKYLGFTRARAQGDVNWYTAQPSVPMSYWLGRLENERLRERLMVRRGWSLQQFNDWLLSFGTLPQAWIEKYGLD